MTYNKNMRRRDYKNLSAGAIYHIYNRGNNKERIFFDEQDYRAFLFRIGMSIGISTDTLNQNDLTKSPRSRVRITGFPEGLFKIHSFCLMPNHFHLLVEQCSDTSISTLMSKICTSFAMYLNKKYKRVGYVFQDRFKSVLMENNAQLMWATSYIHMNPVKDRMVPNPYDYKWSSYNDFANDRNLPIVCKELLIPTFGTKENLIKQTFTKHENMSRTFLDSFGEENF